MFFYLTKGRQERMKGDRSSFKNIYSIPSWAMFRSDHQASYFSKDIFKLYKLFALYNRETALIPILNPSSPNAVFNRDSLNNINTNSSKVIVRITSQILILNMTSFCEFVYKRYETSRKKSYVPFRAEWVN